jgi:hypothetical protein
MCPAVPAVKGAGQDDESIHGRGEPALREARPVARLDRADDQAPRMI